MKQTERDSGLCPCGREPKRPGQRNGARCHALANQVYRAREKQRAAATTRLAMEVIAMRSGGGRERAE